ncbi:MAG: efflux RND transporter periplasmic adaptor subunit [Gammaproteobacteria bacterium]
MKNFLGVLVVLALGVLVGIAMQRYWFDMPGMNSVTPTPVHADKKVLYYRHPMTPSITSERPLKDSMGMDYVPVYADETANTAQASGSATVTISPAVVNNMGVRTATAQRVPLARRINSVGYVGYDEDRLHHVHLRTEGWVENLAVKFAGARVKAGDLLFELYSPKLVNAQEEYVQALSTGNKFLLSASRGRLRALGVPDDLIGRLEKTRQVEQRVKSFAHSDGVVKELNIREGMFIDPATEAMSLVDLSSVWVMADIFEQQAQWAELGQQAEMRIASMPGKVWQGQVDYIYPSLDPVTRTLKLRLRFDNPDELLKPNMYADVIIADAAKQGTLSIPREAVISTGDGQRVIIALGAGKFVPRTIKSGIEAGERIEITDGLSEGESVVVSGQFLIDSESSLKAGLDRLTSVTQTTPSPVSGTTNPVQTAIGTGIVKAVDNTKLNISHGPITSLNWPAMTMDFQLANPRLADGITAGMRIEFEFSQNKVGAYVIRKLTPIAQEGS